MSGGRDATSNSLVGARIGRFDVITEIGVGGMAAVYLARSTGTAGFQRLVAIKVMHPHLTSDEGFVEMFLDEARVASTIHHPHVVPIMDVDVEGDLIFLVMDYIEGDSFSNIERVAIKLQRRIPLKIILRIVLDTLAGLHAAHELCGMDGQHLKIIHRDVSPQNIVIGVDGSSRIVDFGIAKAETRITTTKVGMIKGKLNFMAPEQLKSAPLDRRVDVFGMGVTLWEAVTLRRLYAGDNDIDTARKILSGDYPKLLEIDPKLPAALDEITRKSLAANPNDRFATAAEFADAIESQLGEHIATQREVATFITGVASQKIEKERRAVRDWLREHSPAPASVAPPAYAADPGTARVRPPTLKGPPAPARAPIREAAADDYHPEYDDDGETAMITDRSRPLPARGPLPPGRPEGRTDKGPPASAEARMEIEEARTVFEPRYVPPPAVAAAPRPTVRSVPPNTRSPLADVLGPSFDPEGPPRERREPTQPIQLVQRRAEGPSAGFLPGPAPDAPVAYVAPVAPVAAVGQGHGSSLVPPVIGMPPHPAPLGLRAPAAPSSTAAMLLYVFLAIAVLSSASAVIWFLLHRR